MSTLVVSIGRNIGDEPMSEKHWRRFRGDTLETLVEVYGPDAVVFVGTGDGIYDEGREDSATFILADVLGDLPSALVGRFVKLAEQYGQDSIAVTFGTTRFVGSADEEG